MHKLRQAVFLDRDGTLIEHVPYLSDPEKVRLLPFTREAIQALLDKQYHLFLFTNQSGVGRGFFDLQAVEACNRKMMELLGWPGSIFTQICIAPEHPDQPSIYRKPSPRFILDMIHQYQLVPHACYMVGDSDCDVEAGKAAGIPAIRVGPISLDTATPHYTHLYDFVQTLK